MRSITTDEVVVLYAGTSEQLLAPLETSDDPTVFGSPEFSLSTDGDPGTWVAGSWHSDGWTARTERIDAITPLVGSGQALNIVAGTTYDVFARFTGAQAQVPILHLGMIEVR